ncbi:alpha-(1,3)-fucosyltransferase C [Procambarus clarkii]|uniref:alpha-(1,3)-fucosyltransferase C n=1 Tax=Procambarus clarkii TaxID=6728 RepID=UPI0037437EE4
MGKINFQFMVIAVVSAISLIVYILTTDSLTAYLQPLAIMSYRFILDSERLPGDSNLPYDDWIMKNISSVSADLKRKQPENRTKLYNPPLKKILFWNDFYGDKTFGFGFGREPFLRAKCAVNTCITTANRTMFPLADIDAIVWHARSGDKSFPAKRSPHTRYIFWLLESPIHLYLNSESYTNVFNWTFTYKLDSDIKIPYGRVYRRRKPLLPSYRNYAVGKSKLAAWVVSHCGASSGRDHLFRTLKRWLPIDMYGGCGPFKCKTGFGDPNNCHTMLSADYKFYFAFENSLCQDYATEKFFNVLRLDMVPVVYGFGNYSAQAPPHSYIDALSFPTAKALADYLIYLNNNDTAYNEYFRWKRFHRVPIEGINFVKSYCDLCERLHTDTTPKMYNLTKWFIEDSHCKTYRDKDISDFVNGVNITL